MLRYTHNCLYCSYIGQVGEYDLYHHEVFHILGYTFESIVARWSDEDEDWMCKAIKPKTYNKQNTGDLLSYILSDHNELDLV